MPASDEQLAAKPGAVGQVSDTAQEFAGVLPAAFHQAALDLQEAPP